MKLNIEISLYNTSILQIEMSHVAITYLFLLLNEAYFYYYIQSIAGIKKAAAGNKIFINFRVY